MVTKTLSIRNTTTNDGVQINRLEFGQLMNF